MILRQPEPAYLQHLTALLQGRQEPARHPRRASRSASPQVVLETHDELNFSLPQHCYEYCNTLGWFWDKFEHPQRLKLLYLAAAYLNQAAWHQKLTGDLTPAEHREAANAGASAPTQMAARGRSRAASPSTRRRRWAGSRPISTAATITAPLVRALAHACSRLGNDPHNQEIALCMLEDYGKNRSPDRDRLLLACAQHTAVHRKYGDPLDCSRRFGKALGIAALQ